MFRTIALLLGAMLLEGEGGDDDEKAWTERVAPRLGKLIDERIDAAFDRWLEKGKPAGEGDPPTPPKVEPPAGGNPPPPEPTPSKAPSLMELVFGRSS